MTQDAHPAGPPAPGAAAPASSGATAPASPQAHPQASGQHPAHRPLGARLRTAIELEFGQVRLRLLAFGVLSRLFPRDACGLQRAQVLRWMGFSVGAGARLHGMAALTGGSGDLRPNLVIGAGCTIGWGCVLEIGERITLGEGVTLGPEALVITTTHELGPREHRCGPRIRRPVTIGPGASIGARAIVLPGVTIGEGAQVLAGSVVNKDVAPRTRVGGVPAKPIGPVEPA